MWYNTDYRRPAHLTTNTPWKQLAIKTITTSITYIPKSLVWLYLFLMFIGYSSKLRWVVHKLNGSGDYTYTYPALRPNTHISTHPTHARASWGPHWSNLSYMWLEGHTHCPFSFQFRTPVTLFLVPPYLFVRQVLQTATKLAFRASNSTLCKSRNFICRKHGVNKHILSVIADKCVHNTRSKREFPLVQWHFTTVLESTVSKVFVSHFATIVWLRRQRLWFVSHKCAQSSSLMYSWHGPLRNCRA